MLKYLAGCVKTHCMHQRTSEPQRLRSPLKLISHCRIWEEDNQLWEEHHEETGNQEDNHIWNDRFVHDFGIDARRRHALQVEHIDAEGRGDHAQTQGDAQNQDGGAGVQGRCLDYRQQNGNGNHDNGSGVQEHPHHEEQREDQQHQGQAVQIGAGKGGGHHVGQAGDVHQRVVGRAAHEDPHEHGGDLHGLDQRGSQVLHIQLPGDEGIHHRGEGAHAGSLGGGGDAGIDTTQHQNDDGDGGDDLFKHPHLLAPGGTLGLGDAGAQLGIDGTADADIDDEQQGQAYAGQRTAGKQPACGHAGIGRHDDHDGRGRDNGAQAATCQHGASGQRFIITTVQHSWQCNQPHHDGSGGRHTAHSGDDRCGGHGGHGQTAIDTAKPLVEELVDVSADAGGLEERRHQGKHGDSQKRLRLHLVDKGCVQNVQQAGAVEHQQDD